MPVTYDKIATTTLGSATQSITFSSISGSYTDLVIVLVAGVASGTDSKVRVRLNSDTGTNYSMTNILGDGSTAFSQRGSNASGMDIGLLFNTNSVTNVSIINIMNYANTTTYKTCIARGNNPAWGTGAAVGLWRNTSAVTSVTLLQDGGNNMIIGSIATLYGVKAA